MWFVWTIIQELGEERRGRDVDERAADRLALSGIARGDAHALADLYDRHARRVYSLALRIVQDGAEAEDVVQDVFVQAWRQASRYDAERGTVAAWLLTMTRTRAIDRLRASQGRSRLAEGAASEPASDPTVPPDLLLLTAEQVVAVRAALKALPALQRVALELAYYEGLTHVEIAARLDEPLGTVKTRIRTAMLRLREALAGTA